MTDWIEEWVLLKARKIEFDRWMRSRNTITFTAGGARFDGDHPYESHAPCSICGKNINHPYHESDARTIR